MSLSAESIAQTAKAASEASQLVSATERTRALHEIRRELEANKDAILKANSEDMSVRPSFPPFPAMWKKKTLTRMRSSSTQKQRLPRDASRPRS